MSKRKILKDVAISQLARSCAIGAMWLERAANGEKDDPNTLRAVAAGLMDDVQNANMKNYEIIFGIVGCAYRYFSCLDRGVDDKFWGNSLREKLAELKKNQVDIFDLVYPALSKLRYRSYPYLRVKMYAKKRKDER